MKVAVAFILLTMAALKQKEACYNKRRNRVSSQHFEEKSKASQVRGPQTRPYVIHAETEHRWFKDHEIPVPPDNEKLAPRTKFDKDVMALRKKWKVHKMHDKKCVEAVTFRTHYKNVKGQPLHLNNAWDVFFAEISNCHMYNENRDATIQKLLDDLSNLTVTHVENFGHNEQKDGTQMKLKLTFKNGKQALFKPMRFGLDHESDPNQFYIYDLERPNAEIAAFHLDKLLGFRRAIPTVGRVFDVWAELKENTPENTNKLVYYNSSANNLCIKGTCRQYCDTSHAVCATEGKIRGSVQAWLPAELPFGYIPSPYQRMTDDPTKSAEWQSHSDHCKYLKHRADIRTGRRLPDLVDLAIFDFLIGNQDRHSLFWFKDFSRVNYAAATDVPFLIPLDNGRAFGNPNFDDPDILAPLTQCCIVRPSTVKTLLNFYDGKVTLAKQLEINMQKDPTQPILAQKYLIAIDRRVEIVLQEVVQCLRKANDKKHVLRNNFEEKQLFRSGATQKRITNDDMEHMKKGGQSNQWQRLLRQLRNADEDLVRQDLEDPDLARPEIDADLVTELKNKLSLVQQPDVPCPDEKTHDDVLNQEEKPVDGRDAWDEFRAEMSNCHLYKNDSDTVENLLNNLTTLDIAYVMDTSVSQFQATMQFTNEKKAIFLPMRFGRNYETNPNHFFFDDFDRHHAEIAAFHLDRLLGFRRVPPTVGRVVNIQTDLINKPGVHLNHHLSPGNDCFYGDACTYCDIKHAYCGNPHTIEGSLQVWLTELEKTTKDSPYRKKFDDYAISSERTEDSYCDSKLKLDPQYNRGRLLLDLVDLHIFDFLTANQARKSFKLFNFLQETPEAFIFVTENSKAFGNPHDDDLTILAPLAQCCIIRPSTARMLLDFYEAEVSLGRQLDNSLKLDPLYPILTRKYLVAVNRRVEIILRQVQRCLTKADEDDSMVGVFINEYFHLEK